jgi:hypothetical protein
MSTALVRTFGSDREAAVDRFLARLAALGPDGWGRLDAIAERLDAPDPLSRWRRADRQAAFAAAAPALESVVRGVVFGRSLLADLLGGGGGARARRVLGVATGGGAAATRLDAQLRSLVDLHEAQPPGAHDPFELLLLALLALRARDRLPAEAFARLYGPVERVLPLAAIDP